MRRKLRFRIEMSDELTPENLIVSGFTLAWESLGRKCYHKRCSKRVSMFIEYNAEGVISRGGMTTNDGVIFPLDKQAKLSDVVAAQRIFSTE